MAKTVTIKMFGPEENLRKVQKLMRNAGGIQRAIYPRVQYTNLPDSETVYFEATYEVKEAKLKKIGEKLTRHIEGMTTL